MKVKIRWSEEVSYESTINVDDAELAEYLDGEPVTAAGVQNFLDAGEEREWFGQCRPLTDSTSVNDRGLLGAELLS